VRLKPDIIHCNDTVVLPLGVMVKAFTGAKLIYDAHELESDKNALSKSLGKITLFVERMLWRFVDGLIVVSPSIDDWYKENIGEKKTEVILNSPLIGSAFKNREDDYLRKHFSIEVDSRIFLYVGILATGRGIELMTDSFRKAGIKSSVVFLGYGELSSELKVLAKENANIYVHDAVPHDSVVSIAQSADVGLCLIQNVSLSDYYCLPNKLFEYCFAEIPVLASDFPDISQVVKKYNLGVCCSLDEKSIYDSIKAFEEMDELPKIRAEDLYDLSWAAQEEKLIKLYAELI